MPLDLDPIRARLDAIKPTLWWAAFAPEESNPIPEDREFARHAPTDIAALLSEVDRLTAENEALRSDLARAITRVEALRSDCADMQERLRDFGVY